MTLLVDIDPQGRDPLEIASEVEEELRSTGLIVLSVKPWASPNTKQSSLASPLTPSIPTPLPTV